MSAVDAMPRGFMPPLYAIIYVTAKIITPAPTYARYSARIIAFLRVNIVVYFC